MFEYEPHLIAKSLSFVLMVWFFICLFSPSKKSIFSNVILFLLWLFYSVIMITHSYDAMTYTENMALLIKIDGATGLVLTMFMRIDTKALRHSLVMAFAVMCHTMILYDLTISSSWFTYFFYNFYDELIILVGLIQLWISYDSFNGTCSRISECVHRLFVHRMDNSCSSNKITRDKEKA